MPTYPGLHDKFELAKYSPTIRNAIRRVADTFYVTRSFDCINIDNSKYYGALIRPTDDSSVVLNTQRELLIIFVDYETFEIRTLEAYDEFYSLVDSARVDKSIRFLVSGDHEVERHIKLYLDQHPEYPIIVPITFDHLETRKNPLISAVRNNHYTRDLFGFQSPLREEHFFFGRSDIVSSVIDSAKSGQHSSLFGLRKSGKTSTIYAIERRSKPSELKIVTFDCQDLQVHGRKFSELLVYVVDRIRDKYRLKRLSRPISEDSVIIAEWFSIQMANTLNVLQSNVLLIFDEIENISPRTAASSHWRNDLDSVYFWQMIRSFSQSTKKWALSVCIVGTSPYILEEPKIGGVDNPAYLLTQKRFIPNLTFDETREMVDRLSFFMGLDFEGTAVAHLHKNYGGHPFFTRQVCSRVHQLTTGQRPKSVPMRRVDEAMSQFATQLDRYLYEIVSNLRGYYPEEFKILQALVTGGYQEFSEYWLEAPDLIDHLVGYGLVAVKDGQPEVAFDSIRRAVLMIEPDHKSLNIEHMWSEICVRRGKIEQGLRSTLLIWSRSVSSSDFDAIIKLQLSKKRFDVLHDTSPRYLLSNDKSPLYLTDLISIIGNTKVLPYLEQRRSEIREALQKINELRADAHAKNISSIEFEEARCSFEVVEEEFLF